MRAAAMLPLGSLALRVAVASGVAAASAACLAFVAYDRLLGFTFQLGTTARHACAAAGALLFAWSPALWLQAVRPEVYALQALVMAGFLERVCALQVAGDRRQAGPAAAAGLWFGLGCANHHLLALLWLAPALAVAAGPTCRALRRGDHRPLKWAFVGVATGLLPYAYLPLRAAASPALNLGQPDSLTRFWWVVSAQAFQQNALGAATEPIAVRLRDGVAALMEHGPLVVVLALGGGYLLLRRGPSRQLVVFGVGLAALTWVVRMGLGFVAHNPDALGYLVPTYWVFSWFAVVVPAAILDRVGRGDWGRVAATAVVALLCALSGHQLLRGLGTSLARTHAPLELDLARRVALPPRAVVLLWAPQSVFLHWGGEAVDRGRPDVLWLPVPLLRYPMLAEQLARGEPGLRDLVMNLRQGRVSTGALDRLAARRPVLTELDTRFPADLWGRLQAEGLGFRWCPPHQGEANGQSVTGGMAARRALQQGLRGSRLDGPSAEVLVWQDMHASLFWAARGRARLAAAYLHELAALTPLPPQLQALLGELEGGGRGASGQRVRQLLSVSATPFLSVP